MIKHRRYVTPSGWNAVASNRVQWRALGGDLSVAFLVVGAGYAGLAAARRLAELYPDEVIALIDAGQPAENSSGRNSGFMIDLPYAKIDARSAPEQSQWQIDLLRAGKDFLQTIVDAHGIACGWRQIGHYKAATTDFGVAQLRGVEATLRQHRVPFRELTAEEVERELGSRYYKKAIWLESCTLVQPAELVHGLVEALPANVQAYFDTPVERISGRRPYCVLAGGHEIRARQILLCVNADMPEFGHAKYRQLTLYTYAGMTRELSPAEAAVFGAADDWGLTPVERLEATSRKVGGRRYMLRAGFSYKNELLSEAVSEVLAGMLRVRYPQLPGNMFEHVWGGAVSLTRNGDPYLRQATLRQATLRQATGGVHAVSGCNASGILKMSAMGKLLAESAAGVESALLGQTRAFSRPGFIPPDPLRRIAVHLSINRIARAMKRPAHSL